MNNDWQLNYDKEPSLREIQSMVEEMSATTSIVNKKKILLKHKNCVRILRYVYDPFWQFHITSVNIDKKFDSPNLIGKHCSNIFNLLDMLKGGEISGAMALGTCIRFIKNNKNYKALICSIIDKNLKIRCNASIINKVFPSLIPEFDVALAQPIDETKPPNFETQTWFAARKLDGVRVIAICTDPDHIEFKSREGNEFTSLEILRKQLTKLKLSNTVLDGEVCIILENGAENFKMVVGDIKRKNFTIQNPRYFVFDMLTIDEFNSRSSDRVFEVRNTELNNKIGGKLEPFVTIVKQEKIRNLEHLQNLTAIAAARGWEGLILRKNIGYEGKRSKNMLKVKKFKEEEFVVDSIVVGPMRFIINGKDTEVETLASVVVKLEDGSAVNVGSGFSQEERAQFFKDPSLIVGKTITVSYFERTEDKEGKPSLRFPTFRALWGYKRNI